MKKEVKEVKVIVSYGIDNQGRMFRIYSDGTRD